MKNDYFISISYNDDLSQEKSEFLATLSPRRSDILCKAITDAMQGKTRFLEIARKQRMVKIEIPDGIKVVDVAINANNKNISARLYLPKNTTPTSALLYLHGGGWVIGSPDSCGRICVDICKNLNCVVLAPDYSLAPEIKFPAQVFESVDTFLWMAENAEKFGYPKDKIFICGDSAGGNLAISATIKLLDEEQNLPCGIALFYPVVDNSNCSNDISWQKFGKGFALDSHLMDAFTNAYIENPNDKNHLLVSPIFRNTFADFPPTLIVASGCDILHDQVERFAKKMMLTNAQTRFVNIEQAMHIYMTMDGMEKSYSIGFAELKNFLNHI